MAILEDTIRQQQRRAGADLEATCHICLKTKFADGIGHICHYCNIRCCARCGGKVTLRSNKVIWVCILCRKKQELLSKTGQWIGKQSSPVPFCRMGPDGKVRKGVICIILYKIFNVKLHFSPFQIHLTHLINVRN